MAYIANLANHNIFTYTKIYTNLSNANSSDILYTVPAGLWFYGHAAFIRMFSGTSASSNPFSFGTVASAYNNLGTTTNLDTIFGTNPLSSPSPYILREILNNTPIAPGTAIYVKNSNTITANSTNLVLEVSIIGFLFTAFK